tara:strand:+ start:626 stop:937 length:312 start_codon:yes stop_codon:yes gene_type:complete
MDDETVNMIISEYMGDKSPVPTNLCDLSESQVKQYLPYANSLDALVPVWEKLNTLPCFDEDEKYLCELLTEDIHIDINYVFFQSDSIQKACAYATAKAVLEKR